MNLTIDLGYLVLLAAAYALWRCRDGFLRLVYALRARRLHARMEYAGRCRIVRVVGHVNDTSADQWIANIRKAAHSGQELHLLVHTNGGASQAATRVKHALAEYPQDVVAHVPGFAWSAGTSMVLACDRVWMGPDSMLGPCDRGWPAADNTIFATDQIKAHESGEPVDVVRARITTEEAASELFTYRSRRRAMQDKVHGARRTCRTPEAMATDEHLANQLVRGGWGNHWRPIFRADAKALGFDVVDSSFRNGLDFAELARLTMLSLPEDQR